MDWDFFSLQEHFFHVNYLCRTLLCGRGRGELEAEGKCSAAELNLYFDTRHNLTVGRSFTDKISNLNITMLCCTQKCYAQ